MMDRKIFLQPYAHRGLHAKKRGVVENTAPAFAAAMAKGYGIECDLRPAAEGLPIVFHDETINRLVAGRGPVGALTAQDLKRLTYRDSDVRLQTFTDLLEQVGGKVPLLVEIKSEWEGPDPVFLKRIARSASAYNGAIALMSFDPGVMAMLKEFAPGVPRGIVSGSYTGAGWWNRKLSRQRAAGLRNLLESGPVAPDFYAYEIGALPTPVTEFARRVLGLPLFTWTVRTARDRTSAAKWADAMIFEGFEP